MHEAYLQTILDTALDPYWVIDREGRILDANPAASAATGYSREELLLMRALDVSTDPGGLERWQPR